MMELGLGLGANAFAEATRRAVAAIEKLAISFDDWFLSSLCKLKNATAAGYYMYEVYLRWRIVMSRLVVIRVACLVCLLSSLVWIKDFPLISFQVEAETKKNRTTTKVEER
jgi:hypothetical protein